VGESPTAVGFTDKVCVRLIVLAAMFTRATTAVNVAVVAVVVCAELGRGCAAVEAVCAYAQELPNPIANIAVNTIALIFIVTS
jgi:hypothetical protein